MDFYYLYEKHDEITSLLNDLQQWVYRYRYRYHRDNINAQIKFYSEKMLNLTKNSDEYETLRQEIACTLESIDYFDYGNSIGLPLKNDFEEEDSENEEDCSREEYDKYF